MTTGYTKKKEIDPKLLIPFSKRFCCCMPYSIRQTCSCNEYVYYDAKDKAKQVTLLFCFHKDRSRLICAIDICMYKHVIKMIKDMIVYL